jgi:hypothetical protein
LNVCRDWTPNAAMPANNRLQRGVRIKVLSIFTDQCPAAGTGTLDGG